MKANKTPTGPAMKSTLKRAGIEPQSVVRRQQTGFYVAEFYNKAMKDPVQPSKLYAEAIKERMADLEIIDTHDTVADWRPGKPVIWASVTFKIA